MAGRNRIPGNYPCTLACLLPILLGASGSVPQLQAPASATILTSRIAFTRDGRRAAISAGDAILLMDTAEWKVRRIGSQPGIAALAFSPDGTELALARNDRKSLSPIGVPKDRFVSIFIVDIASGVMVRTLTEARVNAVVDISYTSRGSPVVVAVRLTDENAVAGLYLWNVFDGRLSPVFEPDKSTAMSRCFSSFSPSGDLSAFSIATVWDRLGREEIRIHDAETGSLLMVAERSYSPTAHPLTFSPDGRLLAFSSGPSFSQTDPRIKLYDLALRKTVRSIGDLPFAIEYLAFSGDRILATTGSRNYANAEAVPAILEESPNGTGRLYLLDREQGTVERRIDSDRPLTASRLVPGQDLLISATFGVFAMHDLRTGRLKSTLDAADPAPQWRDAGARMAQPRPSGAKPARSGYSALRILALSFVSGSRVLASSGDDGGVTLWDVMSGKEVARREFAPGLQPLALSASGKLAGVEHEGALRVADVAGGQADYRIAGFGEQPAALAFSPMGDWLACGGANGSIRIWRAGETEPRMEWKGHDGAVRSLAFSNDSTRLASGGDDMTVRVWDPSSGKEVRSLKGHSGRVLGVAFGADSRQLASCGEDSAVILWETGTSRIAKRLKDPGGAVRSVCFSPDGSQLVSGGDNSLRLWDVQKRELIKVLSERPQRGRAVDTISFNESIMVSSFSPDGAVLACGCTNNTVVVWDAKTWDRRILRPAR